MPTTLGLPPADDATPQGTTSSPRLRDRMLTYRPPAWVLLLVGGAVVVVVILLLGQRAGTTETQRDDLAATNTNLAQGYTNLADAVRGECAAGRLTGPICPQAAAVVTSPEVVAGRQGLQGVRGEAGAQGAQGPQGPMGPMGPMGPAGKDGTNGVDGKPGRDGVNGQDGTNGQDGANGTDGARGPEGPAGPPGGTCPDGETRQPYTWPDGVDGSRCVTTPPPDPATT